MPSSSTQMAGLHKAHAALVLFLSAILYTLFFAQFHAYNNTHGGGQQTLPGMDAVVTLAMIVIALLVGSAQYFLFRLIRKKAHIGAANLAITLPLIILIPVGLRLLELPESYSWFVFANLFLSNILFYLFIRYQKFSMLWLSGLHLTAILVICTYWWQRSESNIRWWDNGKVTRYYDNGNKEDEAENKKEGIVYGNFTQWNYDGTLAAFDRYPNGHNKPADSSVKYFSNGTPMTIEYRFDSAGDRYERVIAYNWEGYLFHYRTNNTRTLQSSYTDYDPKTRTVKIYEYTFDSSSISYTRQLQYRKNGLWRNVLINRKTNKITTTTFPKPD